MLNHAYSNIVKMIHPNSVVTLKVGTKSVDDNVATSVWGFFSIYVISFVILLMAVLISGLDLETAFSAVGACLNNWVQGLAWFQKITLKLILLQRRSCVFNASWKTRDFYIINNLNADVLG